MSRWLAVLVLLIVGLTPGAAAPASADVAPTGWLTARDGVLYIADPCAGQVCEAGPKVAYSFGLSAPLPEGWLLNVVLRAPDGRFVSSEVPPGSSGTDRTLFVSTARPHQVGEYTVTATVSWYDGARWREQEIASDRAMMRRAHAMLDMQVYDRAHPRHVERTPHRGELLTVVMRARGVGPHGVYPMLLQPLLLQRWRDGRWRGIRKVVRVYDNSGRADVGIQYNGRRTKLRFVAPMDGYDHQVSPVITLRPGR